MDCKHWSPGELFPFAKDIADALFTHKFIVGVGVVGSLARWESDIHDLDIIIFHNGLLRDCVAFEPSFQIPHPDDKRLPHTTTLISSDTRTRIQKENHLGVPINFTLVNQRLFQDCKYLQQLHASMPHDNSETYKIIAQHVMILRPQQSRGKIAELIKEKIGDKEGPTLESVFLEHNCQNPACKPVRSTEQLFAALRERRRRSPWHCTLK